MARQSKGRIFTRGKQKRFYLQYYVNGKQFAVALKDADGNPITDPKAAKYAAADILNPVNAANKADQLKKIRAAVEDAETKAERLAEAEAMRRQNDAERARNRKATIADGWRLFMTCPKRPASCKRYPEDAIPRHTTAANYRSYYERFTEWIKTAAPSALLLSDVTPENASAFMDVVKRENASGTFNKYLQFFNCFFDTLSHAGKISAENPFRDIDRAEHRYNSKKPLSVEQIARLINTATGELKLLFALGYFSGLRMGDCCTLEWREIDLLRGVIERIPRKTAHTIKDPAQAIVKIGIAPYLGAMLSEIPATERRGYLLPGFAEKYLAGGDQQITKKVLKHFADCGIETHRPGTGLKTVVDPETGAPIIDEKTGKPKTEGRRAVVEIGFHSLRYSYISHNAEAGTPAAIIQRNAGHASPAMTEHYTKISDSAAVRYAAALNLPELPMRDAAAVIDACPVEDEPRERAELRALADTLPLETVREILNHYRGA